MSLLRIHNLQVSFRSRHGIVRAVNGVSYDLKPGEIIGIVGESGSGKSVTHQSILRLLPSPPAHIDAGEILFDGLDLAHCSEKQLRPVRGKRISMIFQDPMTCLNPYLKIGTQLMEPLFVHENLSHSEAKKRAVESLASVGIVDAERRLEAYPHQFSGGMRQRVMIAMALITNPQILIADEPTTALDVTVEAQIMALIRKKQQETGMSVIMISHNLAVVGSLAHRIFVMYAGRIIESGLTDDIFYRPQHPYTKALLSSLPSTHQKGERLTTITGLPPDMGKPITGCPFAPRCSEVMERCWKEAPQNLIVDDSHKSACHLTT